MERVLPDETHGVRVPGHPRRGARGQVSQLPGESFLELDVGPCELALEAEQYLLLLREPLGISQVFRAVFDRWAHRVSQARAVLCRDEWASFRGASGGLQMELLFQGRQERLPPVRALWAEPGVPPD